MFGAKKICTGGSKLHYNRGSIYHYRIQLEFIEDHREVSPEVFEIVYSDGTRVTCNYREHACTLENKKSKETIKI